MCILGALASLLRGGKYHYEEPTTPGGTPAEAFEPVPAQEAVAETEPLLVD